MVPVEPCVKAMLLLLIVFVKVPVGGLEALAIVIPSNQNASPTPPFELVIVL